METQSAWKKISEAEAEKMESLARDYISFISDNKTERECVRSGIALAQAAGYKPLTEVIKHNETLVPGDKIWADAFGKALILLQVGSDPILDGVRILGAHIDSPRLDIKQNPLFESNELAYLDTHYYGGIKHYQWVTLPLAMHGVVAKTDGSVVDVVIGEDPDDPVFCVTDLLIHLASAQMGKNAKEVVEGEALDILVGNKPLIITSGDSEESTDADAHKSASTDAKEAVKALALQWLEDVYGIQEEDFLSAELEMVPAGRARELGFDRSMVIGYGQDDKVCAYTSLVAQLSIADEILPKTSVCVLVDKEEIGSVGATGMTSRFFENTLAHVAALLGFDHPYQVNAMLAASRMLSSDVSAGFDPAYSNVFEPKNSAFLGHGLVFNKYTGARGKSGSNDARAEYMAWIRGVMDEAEVAYQTAELGRVDAGGGGTIAYIPAEYGMDVIDSGVAVLSMHSPWEVTSKVDIYEAEKGYEAFLRGQLKVCYYSNAITALQEIGSLA